MSKRAFYRIVWILSAIAIVSMLVLFAVQPAALSIPGEMIPYTTSDHSLSLLHPKNWKPRERSSQAIKTEIRFEPSAEIRMVITADLQGSLLGDILKTGSSELGAVSNMVGGEKQKSPLEVMHELQAKELSSNRAEYPEFQDGDTEKAQIAGYEALVTKFSFQLPGAFGSRPMSGRRVTLLARDHEISCVYWCNREMKGIYMKFLEEMRDSLKLEQTGG